MAKINQSAAWRDEAAQLLDATHEIAFRGPRTMIARTRLAAWLDGQKQNLMQISADMGHLRTVAQHGDLPHTTALGLHQR